VGDGDVLAALDEHPVVTFSSVRCEFPTVGFQELDE
jgi:hypothetical protein